MKNPGDTLNVPCDWCNQPSSYSIERKHKEMPTGIYLYACAEDKPKLDALLEELSKYKVKR